MPRIRHRQHRRRQLSRFRPRQRPRRTAQRRPRRHHIIHQHHPPPLDPARPSQRKRPAHIVLPIRHRAQPSLARRIPHPHQRPRMPLAQQPRQSPRHQLRLVIPSGNMSSRMQRHRHKHLRPMQQFPRHRALTKPSRQFIRQPPRPPIFQIVNKLPQRIVKRPQSHDAPKRPRPPRHAVRTRRTHRQRHRAPRASRPRRQPIQLSPARQTNRPPPMPPTNHARNRHQKIPHIPNHSRHGLHQHSHPTTIPPPHRQIAKLPQPHPRLGVLFIGGWGPPGTGAPPPPPASAFLLLHLRRSAAITPDPPTSAFNLLRPITIAALSITR